MTPIGSAGHPTPQPAHQNSSEQDIWNWLSQGGFPPPPAHMSIYQYFQKCQEGQIQPRSAQLATRTISPVSTQGSSSSETGSDSETSHSYDPVPVASTSTQPTASSSTEQSTSPAPQSVAVAGTSGVQSGYSRLENKQYQCNTCQHVTNTKYNMETHLRKHTGEKPYQCQYCDKSFAAPTNKIRHLRTHTGEKPFQCQYCDKSFTQQANKITHERIHTGEKTYKCQKCDYTGAQLSQLNYHMRTKHQSQQTASDTDQPPEKKPKHE